jgi:hypothetical protein
VDAAYDFASRRVRKQVYAWNSAASAYQLSAGLRYFYRGWNLIGQLDEVTGTRISFMWGTDLSGSMQGAGGVGGLKAMLVHNGPLAGTYFYTPVLLGAYFPALQPPSITNSLPVMKVASSLAEGQVCAGDSPGFFGANSS